ncbi:MAG: fluoride efflux transporter CrcB [Bauldia sp.]
MDYLVVFLGGGVGAALRHGVNGLAARTLGAAFPFGTLAVNVVGSLLMGLLGGYFALRGDPVPGLRLFATTGILGGFTTFSAFSMDAVMLFERGDPGLAAGYAAGSVAIAVAALAVGLTIARGLP